MGVGAKSCVNKSSGLGSSAVKVFVKSFATLFFALFSISSISKLQHLHLCEILIAYSYCSKLSMLHKLDNSKR